MTFDITGLVIFLLGILPGFVAQQSRHLVTPRSLEQKSVIEETGEYFLNSILVHFLLIVLFGTWLSIRQPSTLVSLSLAINQRLVAQWVWQHRCLISVYFLTSLAAGFAVGVGRGTMALNQPVRNWLIGFGWFQSALRKAGIHSFLQVDPVWYGVFRQRDINEIAFVMVRMKGDAGFYTGELRSYGIVEDSKHEKDFFLVNAYFRSSPADQFIRLDADGVLLNFADVYSIDVIKRAAFTERAGGSPRTPPPS